jgi:hypothetical protein
MGKLPTKTALKALFRQKQTHPNPNMRPIHPAYGEIASIKLDVRDDHKADPDDEHDISSISGVAVFYLKNTKPIERPHLEGTQIVHVKVIYGEFHWEDDDSASQDNWNWLGIAFDNHGDLDTADPDYIDLKESCTKSDITEYCLSWV